MLTPLVLRQLESRHGWAREFAEQVYPYYVATLRSLAAGRPTAVYQVVDDMWHAHILCTRDYADFCTREFGAFVHHEPFDASEADEDHANSESFAGCGLSSGTLERLCAQYPQYLTASGANLASAKCVDPFNLLARAKCTAPDEPPLPLARAKCTAPGPHDSEYTCHRSMHRND